MDSTLVEPLPVHQEIANLPLSAIITTTWDGLIENTLSKANFNYHTIINDTDIPFFGSGRVPVLRLHGSLERPDSIIATTDDLLEVFHTRPLVADFLRVLCAQKTILFIGYDLNDLDFMQLHRELRRQLGEFLPDSYAIHPRPSQINVKYWEKQRVQIVKGDVADFLQRLNSFILFKHMAPKMVIQGSSISWIDDPFLRTVLGIGRLPTANQIIDGIATAVLHQLESDLEFEVVAKRIQDVIESLTAHRPKHRTLIQLREKIIPQWFPPVCSSKLEARKKVLSFIEQRSSARKRIGQRGAELIVPGDLILTYSQSTCVIEVLNSYLERSSPKDGIGILIAECRPKSPEVFQDALTIVRQIKKYDAPFRLIPDAAISYLMRVGQITKVFMGSHGLMIMPDQEIRATNTTGTFALCLLAAKYSIPVYFFAEEVKIYHAKNQNEVSPTAYNLYPEELLFDDKNPSLLRTLSGRRIQLDNPGYDDVSSRDVPFSVVTDTRVIQAGPSVTPRSISDVSPLATS